MLAGRRGAAGWLVGLALTGCLSPPPIDDTGTSSTGADGSSSTGGPADTSSSSGDIMTSTAAETGTGGPGSCDDGERNQGESDVDCGGPCEPCPEGQACISNQDCATMACSAGTCVAAACLADDECAAIDGACTRGVCDPDSFTCVPVPANEGEDCDDGSLCTSESACLAGACEAVALADCSGFDSPCTVGKCEPETGACIAVDVADGIGCDDGNNCTIAEVCQAGSCVTDEAGALFFDDFSMPAEWTLDDPWEFAAATASQAALGGADPAADHSPGADNMLAGTVVGGLDALPAHPRRCMTSPPIDATAADMLWVTFWRHLHAPAQPDVVHTVDVWNGATWKNLQKGYEVVTNDAAWTRIELNASGYGAVDFRVRICVERLAGAPDFAGWSVDDVTVASVACTP
jgi:hypothetical protein